MDVHQQLSRRVEALQLIYLGKRLKIRRFLFCFPMNTNSREQKFLFPTFFKHGKRTDTRSAPAKFYIVLFLQNRYRRNFVAGLWTHNPDTLRRAAEDGDGF